MYEIEMMMVTRVAKLYNCNIVWSRAVSCVNAYVAVVASVTGRMKIMGG